MKTIILFLIFASVLFSCQSTDETTSNEILSVKNREFGMKFFDYDQIEFYSYPLVDTALSNIYENKSKSDNDSIKEGVVAGHIPKDISDQIFIDKLEKFGYKKKLIDSSKFKQIDSIFIEKTAVDHSANACLYVFRDILIFKKKSNVVGIAKICFGCGGNEISGTNANTTNFGQGGDYDTLEKILR